MHWCRRVFNTISVKCLFMFVFDRHRCHMAAKFKMFVDVDHSKLPTLYWLPKLHKRPYKSRLLLILVYVKLLS